jgi:tRNA threonylcarbamoyladenosine biosynthesis protein TsaE
LHYTLITSSPDDTKKLADTIAPLLGAGDVLLLIGVVGAGKTDLSRKIIQNQLAAFGKYEDVPSPTFTLVQTYDLDEVEFIHADLYRLSHPDEVYELGLDRAFDDAICLIEWPDRLGSLAPPNALSINITIIDDTRRKIQFLWTDPRWTDRMDKLKTRDLGADIT